MEQNKVRGEAKSFTTSCGAELTYCELGREHDEVVMFPGFFFHTFMDVAEIMAERYHVVCMVMRFDGPGSELHEDGEVNWTRQWGADLYELCRGLGVERFWLFGKCHGSLPGWYMAKNHPEMVLGLASFFLAPHVKGQDGNSWFESMANGASGMMSAGMRKPETGTPKKMVEVEAIGMSDGDPEAAMAQGFVIQRYGGCAEAVWDTPEECDAFIRSMEVPVGYLFGTEDPLFQDYKASNIHAITHTRGSRTVFLQGECHLMEIDCPERAVSEFYAFVDDVRAGFYRDVIEHPCAVSVHADVAGEDAAAGGTAAESEQPQAASAAADGPDPDLAGAYKARINTPMGEQDGCFEFSVDGEALSGSMEMMGKRLVAKNGRATKAGFSFDVVLKVAFRKIDLHIEGARDGDAVEGAINSPMGQFKFAGRR